MTGLLAVENAHPQELLTVSRSAVDISEPLSSNIALREGEELTVESAIFAMMLHSANDASNVLAEHIAGTQEDFASRMTMAARMVGAMNTNFTNAHGLHDDEHYTTAYDIALITRHAAGDARFMEYFGRDRHTMPATNRRAYERVFTNYQYMLMEQSRFYDPEVLGGKIGFTNPAAHTMSTIAERDGRTLIAVVMGSYFTDDKYRDTRLLLDFGFEQFERVTIDRDRFTPFAVPVHGAGNAVFDSARDFYALVHRDYLDAGVFLTYSYPDVFYPGDRLSGKISYYLADSPPNVPQLLGGQEIIGRAPPDAVPAMAFAPLSEAHDSKVEVNPAALWVLLVLFAALPFIGYAARRFAKL
jgi:D-alanyl-D-alanine carboxypeptidase (penicillin-binding protein 5/6)